MATIKVTKKIEKKETSKPQPVEKVVVPVVEQEERGVDSVKAAPKKCSFCLSKKNPSYTDSAALKRFVSDRAKIVPKMRSGLCTKHQRKITKQIKYARHLGLLPFTPKV